MLLLQTSRQFVAFPFDAPDDADLASAEIALIADDGTEPAAADWHPAATAGGKLYLLIGPGADNSHDYAPGEYASFVRCPAGSALLVTPSIRVRIGLGH